MRTLMAIYGGADLTEETKKLADEFTDRHTARFATWWRELFARDSSRSR